MLFLLFKVCAVHRRVGFTWLGTPDDRIITERPGARYKGMYNNWVMHQGPKDFYNIWLRSGYIYYFSNLWTCAHRSGISMMTKYYLNRALLPHMIGLGCWCWSGENFCYICSKWKEFKCCKRLAELFLGLMALKLVKGIHALGFSENNPKSTQWNPESPKKIRILSKGIHK